MIAPTATYIPLKSVFLAARFLIRREDAVREFEKTWSKYLGSRYTFAMSSGRACLYVALEVLRRISSRKEVIIPANICGSVYRTVEKVGLNPVLVDVDLDSLNTNADYIGNMVNKNTLAVVLAHIYGIPADVKRVKKICNEHGVHLIEDVAQAAGNSLSGHKLGTFGDFGFFSFGKSKPFTTINGGLLATNNKKYAEQITKYIDTHVKHRSMLYDPLFLLKIIIYKYSIIPIFYRLLHRLPLSWTGSARGENFQLARLSTSQALLGIELLKNLDEMNNIRKNKARYLINELKQERNTKIPRTILNNCPCLIRLPVIFKSRTLQQKSYKQLLRNGIKPAYSMDSLEDSGIQYVKNTSTYSNSFYLKDHLLLIPIHYFVHEKILKTLVNILKTN